MSDKTLIVGPSWVGDMVMAQTLFKAIKNRYPDTLIEVLAPAWSSPITERMLEVSKSISMPLKHGELGIKPRIKLGKMLKNQYQRCYILPNSFKSALVPFFAKIPERIGWRGEWRYLLLNRLKILNKKKYPLMVQRYMALALADESNDLLESVHSFRPSLVVNATHVKNALEKHQLNQNKGLILALCPGAEFGPSKRWPSEYFAEVARRYLTLGWQVWILGSQKDNEVAQKIQTMTTQNCIDLTGRTSLAEAIDLLSLARLVISNDSGLMHIAAALDRPLVALYGSTDPTFTPPLNHNVEILQEKINCSPCFERHCPLGHHHCMKQLKVEKVFQAIDRVMSHYPCVS